MNEGLEPALGLLAFLSVVAVVVLAVLLVRQLRDRRQLRDWIVSGAQGEVPEGAGAWREIFSGLQRLRKEDFQARTALQLERDRFRQAVQALPGGVILLDNEGYIEWFNPVAADHFGLDAQRDPGTLLEELIRGSDFHEFLSDFRSGKDPAPLVMPGDANGERRVLSLSLHAFAATGTLLLSSDVSEIVKTETIRRDFVANVSHELRTPLTVITGFLEQLASDSPPTGEQARTILALMTAQSARMNRLLGDLLTLSRLEADMQPPRDEKVDVAEMLDGLLADARALSEGRHTIVVSETGAGCLTGSAEEIRSAFGNLVSNAVRYTPGGGTITLSWQLVDGCPVFAVKDTGIGIPREHVPRLTERFYRVDKGRSSSTGGTGLGLAIVKHVLARHGGKLEIESQVGSGSIFSAQFPAERLVQRP
jgi:two-component system phosphate regulon sensor histidine kinase PhoR